MTRKGLIYGLLILFTATTTLAFADQVYVTEKGSKYHKAECRLVKNKEPKAMDKDEAIASGHEPCKVCFKEDLVTNESSDQEKLTQNDKKSNHKK